MTGHKKYIQFSGNMVKSPQRKWSSWKTHHKYDGFNDVENGYRFDGQREKKLDLHAACLVAFWERMLEFYLD